MLVIPGPEAESELCRHRVVRMKEATAKRREPEDVEMKEEEPAAGSTTGEGGKKELDSVTLEGIYLSPCCFSSSYRL